MVWRSFLVGCVLGVGCGEAGRLSVFEVVGCFVGHAVFWSVYIWTFFGIYILFGLLRVYEVFGYEFFVLA